MNADKIQENPITGMRTIVIETPEETGGRRVVVEYQLQPGTGRGYTVAHIHRRYVERFEILSGRAAYVLNGVTGAAIAGETVIVPIGTSHVHPWSVGDEPLVVRQTTEAVAPRPSSTCPTKARSTPMANQIRCKQRSSSMICSCRTAIWQGSLLRPSE